MQWQGSGELLPRIELTQAAAKLPGFHLPGQFANHDEFGPFVPTRFQDSQYTYTSIVT